MTFWIILLDGYIDYRWILILYEIFAVNDLAGMTRKIA